MFWTLDRVQIKTASGEEAISLEAFYLLNDTNSPLNDKGLFLQ